MRKFHFSILLILGLLVGTESFAQMAVDKGSKFLNAGIGLGGWGGIGYSGGLGFGASFELGVAKNITVGGVGAFRGYSGVGSYYSIGARGSYHFNEILSLANDKVDLYAGLGLIYSGWSWNESFVGFRGSYGGIGLGGHLGGRYFFSDKIGGFAEAGFGVAPLQLGVTFKF
ncbi:hypothetical protein [Spirosoma montaniterrae]|uniref:Outer membrane protein beta-barrel domain-containing protein n=1 Tax=Spirosoma montaniterrae TaxID=1178516 RepID=A0A1P9X290_9BACT|nr:hypothetical protein [Spirosoma montaniterrae]AQG81746.1 hypothetical protein AWR27_22040 [Spirosoma montaniterrae]